VRRISVVLLTCLSLSNCGITRVSESSHAKSVSKIDAVGVSLDVARGMAVKAGFQCNEHIDRNRSVQGDDGVVRKTNTLSCDKTSLELVCPQRRYVVFNADPKSGKVYSVGNRITEHSCF
jgi:hypothetical protein